jgi:Kef-type K+ transport system membrane component KefB
MSLTNLFLSMLPGSASAPAPAPASLLSLEGLRAADPVLGIALLMIIALLASEAVSRYTRLPRAVGPMLVGALAGPLLLRLLERSEIDPWKPLLDLAVGVLVFELGARIRPRWLIDNPWLAAKGVAEALLAGLLVALALWGLGAAPSSAALAGAVAMSTSPVITIAVVHECKPRGQVTERLLLMAALNSMLAVLAIKIWRVVATADAPGAEIAPALANAVYVLAGSFLLGAAAGMLLKRLSVEMRSPANQAVLQLAIVVLAAMLAVQFTLSPLLALLIAGVVARLRMAHSLTVEPQLGTAGTALTVLLLLTFGLLSTFEGWMAALPWVLAFIVARLAGKAIGVMAFARPSGLSYRQAIGLTLALQPTSSLAILLTATNFGWPASYPTPDAAALQALLIATSLMQLTGPWWTQLGLQLVASESLRPEPEPKPEPKRTAEKV